MAAVAFRHPTNELLLGSATNSPGPGERFSVSLKLPACCFREEEIGQPPHDGLRVDFCLADDFHFALGCLHLRLWNLLVHVSICLFRDLAMDCHFGLDSRRRPASRPPPCLNAARNRDGPDHRAGRVPRRAAGRQCPLRRRGAKAWAAVGEQDHPQQPSPCLPRPSTCPLQGLANRRLLAQRALCRTIARPPQQWVEHRSVSRTDRGQEPQWVHAEFQ